MDPVSRLDRGGSRTPESWLATQTFAVAPERSRIQRTESLKAKQIWNSKSFGLQPGDPRDVSPFSIATQTSGSLIGFSGHGLGFVGSGGTDQKANHVIQVPVTQCRVVACGQDGLRLSLQRLQFRLHKK